MTIEVTDADVEAVEAIVGMGSAAWDCVDPKEIIAAAWEVMKRKHADTMKVDRDQLGRMVRELWISWAEKQHNPKPSWIVPYDELSESDKEADRVIGEGMMHEFFALMCGEHLKREMVKQQHADTLADAVLEASHMGIYGNGTITFKGKSDSVTVEVSSSGRGRSAVRIVSNNNFAALATAAVRQLSQQVRQ